jgi:hypothetical protein
MVSTCLRNSTLPELGKITTPLNPKGRVTDRSSQVFARSHLRAGTSILKRKSIGSFGTTFAADQYSA